jgi:hypothetical protein
MEDIFALLEHVRYPASRLDVINAAVASDLTSESIARLRSLDPDKRYGTADEVAGELVVRRAESNPSIVAITPEVCERCGFAHAPGEAHSCVEEKALFAESVQGVSDSFERIDESNARQAVSEDLRSGPDRRQGGTEIAHPHERRHPARRADGRAGESVDNGGQRRDSES